MHNLVKYEKIRYRLEEMSERFPYLSREVENLKILLDFWSESVGEALRDESFRFVEEDIFFWGVREKLIEDEMKYLDILTSEA